MGGKRKKSNNGPIKKESRYKIPARFDCPLCDAKSSIAVKISRALGTAMVHCRACQVGKDRVWAILPLEKGVDVFFRFREELLELDKSFLKGHCTEASGVDVNDAVTNLTQLGQRCQQYSASLANARVSPNRHGASEFVVAATSQRQHGYASDETGDGSAAHFLDSSLPEDDQVNVYENEEDRYAAMFQ